MTKRIKHIFLWLPFVLLTLYLVVPDVFSIFHGLRVYTVNDMEQQQKITSQEISAFLPDSAFYLTAPNKSVPKGTLKYRFHQVEYDSAVNRLTNPLSDDKSVLARGKNRYEIFCLPCHGHDGKGIGLIVTKPILTEDEEGMPAPADLTRPNAVNLPDARIFHILSAGQNLMFPIEFKMNETDRWAVVRYVRLLQKY